MKVRAHQGSLFESMKTMQEIEPTLAAVQKYFGEFFSGTPLKNFEVKPYAQDDRIGWNTHIVTCEWPDGVRAPVGWTDMPLELSEEESQAMYDEWLAERPEIVREVAKRFKPWHDYQFKNSKRLCYVQVFEEPIDGSPVTLKVLQPDLFGFVDHLVFGVNPNDIEPADEHCVRPL